MPVTGVFYYMALFTLLTLTIMSLSLLWKLIQCILKKKRKKSYVIDPKELEVSLIASYNCQKQEFPVLPTELWFEILEYVSLSQDFLSCINSFPLWNRVLGPRKTTELLQFVFPHIEEYLDKATLLRCRLVSTQWKSVVEELIRNQNTKSDKYIPGCFIGSRIDKVRNEFKTLAEVQDFISQMEPFIPSNPFPSRTLNISISPLDFDVDDDTLRLYATIVPDLVTNFGHQIHTLYYTMKVYEPSTHFPQLLHFLPNLKELRITIPFMCTPGYAEVIGRAYQQPMPRLPFLKILSLITPKGLHLAPIMLTAFLRNYGDQLEALDVSEGALFGSLEPNEISTLLPRYQDLNLDMVDDDTCRRLFQPPRWTWALRRLCLTFPRKFGTDFNQERKVKLETILCAINSVAKSLTELHLILNWTLKDWDVPLYLEGRKEQCLDILGRMSTFPRLKTLVISDDLMEVAVVQHLVSKNFVGLERLVIDMGVYEEYFRGRRIYEDEENPLWELSPHLKKIERVSLTVTAGILRTGQIKNCTRDQYICNKARKDINRKANGGWILPKRFLV